jgi:hypothetical protein
MQAYCVKCRAKKEMKDAKAITMKNGRAATRASAPPAVQKYSESARPKRSRRSPGLSEAFQFFRGSMLLSGHW